MFVWFSLPAYLSVIIDDVGLTGTQAGFLAGAVPLTYIPLALFSGLAIDRIGATKSLAIGLVILGVGQVVRSVAQGFPSLLATSVLIGIGGTAITFGLPKLVSTLFPLTKTGLPSSIYLVGASIGNAGAFAVGRPILGPALGGWRPLFLWSGIFAISYAPIWLGIDRSLSVQRNDSAGRSPFTFDSLSTDLRTIVFHRQLQLIVVVAAMYLLVLHGMQGWLPTILESRGASTEIAGQATGLFVIAYVGGILAVPYLADKLSARREAVILCGSFLVIGVSGVIIGRTEVLAVGGIVVSGIGVGGLSPLVRAIPPEIDGVGARLTGVAVGFVFAVGEIGGFLGPFLIGIIYDVLGSYTPGLLVLVGGGFAVVGVGIALTDV